MAPHSSTLAWKIPRNGGAWWAAVHGVARSRTRLSDFTFTFHFHALEKEMATLSSVHAWRIPGTGESGGLPSMGSHRVWHDWSNLGVAARMLFCLNLWFQDISMECYWSKHGYVTKLGGFMFQDWKMCTFLAFLCCTRKRLHIAQNATGTILLP